MLTFEFFILDGNSQMNHIMNTKTSIPIISANSFCQNPMKVLFILSFIFFLSASVFLRFSSCTFPIWFIFFSSSLNYALKLFASSFIPFAICIIDSSISSASSFSFYTMPTPSFYLFCSISFLLKNIF